MWNVESREKVMFHHLPWLFFSFLLVEVAIGSQEDHYHAHTCSPLHDVGTILPTPSDHGCSSSSWRMGDKMFYHPLCWGSSPLSSANCRSIVLFFNPHREPTFASMHWTVYCFSSIIVDRERKLWGFLPLIDGCGFPHALLTELPLQCDIGRRSW